MSLSKHRPSDFPTEASAAAVDDDYLILTLVGGIIVKYPLLYFPELAGAEKKDKMAVKVFAGGKGLVWESLDVHLNVPRLLGFTEDD